jgi:hypothetical protein
MPSMNGIARTLNDLGLATWFGGSLMGAVGLNSAAGEVSDPGQRARVADAGWARWTPVNSAAIGAYVAGGTVLLVANKGRLAGQAGVASVSTTKAVLSAAAIGVTAYSRVLGRRMQEAGDVPVAEGAVPSSQTPPEIAKIQQQLRVLQWAIPALTGGMIVCDSILGEQQRTTRVLSGVARRLVP